MISLTKKDIISTNQEIGEEGQFHNENSLDFAISMNRRRKDWLYELAYLLRSLLVDHAFRDGNKRTAMAITILYLKDRGIEFDNDRLIKSIHEIAKKNYVSVEKIMRTIKNAVY